MTRIAHCTDFSANAAKALENVVFNFWSFNITVEIFHWAEEDFEASKKSLETLKTNLEREHSLVNFKTQIFREKDKLITELNTEGYFGLILGLDGTTKKAGLGSFLKEIYKSYLGDLVIVPSEHEIKIENKILIMLEYENVDKLHSLVRISNFINFQFSKLQVIVSTEIASNDSNIAEVKNFLDGIFETAKYEILVDNKQNCNNYLIDLVNNTKLDLCIVYKDDYYAGFMLDQLSKLPVEQLV